MMTRATSDKGPAYARVVFDGEQYLLCVNGDRFPIDLSGIALLQADCAPLLLTFFQREKPK